MAKLPIEWGLSIFYKSPDDPKIKKDAASLLRSAVTFEKKHSGKVATYTAKQVLAALKELSKMAEAQTLVYAYAELGFSKNTKDPKFSGLLQQLQVAGVDVDSHLVFFDLELAVNKSLEKFAKDKTFGQYGIILKKLFDNKKYQLSSPEEKILNLKSVTSRAGWSDLLDKLDARLESKVTIAGKEKTLGEPEVLQLLYSPDRKVRKAGTEAFSTTLKRDVPLFVHVYNMLLVDHRHNGELRKVESPETFRTISNSLTQGSVDALVKAVRGSYAQVERFYKIKAKLLRIPKLEQYDRYAPLPSVRSKKASYAEAVKTVGAAYASFDAQFAEIFYSLVNGGAVDVYAGDGKRGGAFCMQMPPGHRPYVLLNYLGSERDVETLAHEMGHAIQDTLTQKLPYIVAYPPLVLAETSSIFGEMIVFDAALKTAKSKQEKISMLTERISHATSTIFRQTAMFQFERLAHAHVAKHGHVSAEDLSAYWLQTQREMFGTSMNLDDSYGQWWSYIPHFYHTPFYVYAYSFGNLLVFSLYEKYKQGMPGFVEKYKELLALGGSKTPQEAVQPFGFDLEDPKFWANGTKLFTRYVDELESMV